MLIEHINAEMLTRIFFVFSRNFYLFSSSKIGVAKAENKGGLFTWPLLNLVEILVLTLKRILDMIETL
jgi:hypothetical protein